MQIIRDIYGRQRQHQLILCNPNGKELAVIGMAKDIEVYRSLKEVSTLNFTVTNLGNEITPYYDLLENKRLVKVDGYGNFIISKVETKKEGTSECKEIECVSIEYEFSSKIISFDGSYKLYSASDYDNTLVGLLLSYMPNWKIKYVDSEVANKTRYFEITEQNIYNIIKEEVEKAYDCIFEFNIETREVSIYKVANRIKKTNIFLSERNLVKQLDIESDSQNIITALSVYGSGDLSIANVNPLGNATIYDFSYYMNTAWMEQDLIDALTAWQKKVDDGYNVYGNMLTNYKTLTEELLKCESELYDLNNELSALNQAHGLAVTANDNEETSRLNKEVEQKKREVENKKREVENKKTAIDRANTNRQNLIKSLSFDNNFTKEQITSLNIFIEQSKVQNEAYYQGENDTVEDVQNLCMELLEWGRESLRKQSQPKYSFSIDIIDFTNIISKSSNYDQFTKELDLGSSVTICIDKEKDYYANAILIGYTKALNSNDSIKLEFCSRLDNGTLEYTWEELINQTSNISTQFAFEEYKYKQGVNANNTINDYINNALDLSKQMIMTSDNQEFTISDVGIRGKEWLEDEQRYSNEEIWMQKNIIAFSDDNFNTVKQAIGKITLPDGSESYGVVADSIVGRILIGGELFLQNESNTFRVDTDGVYIKDANITMTNSEGHEQTISEFIRESSDFSHLLTENGLLDTNKMEGQILAGTNNIYIHNKAKKNAMLINETGILIANSMKNNEWDWSTAISGDGISANIIQANTTLSGVNIVGGTLDVGDGNFKVNSTGDVTIKKGSINLGNGNFSVNNNGDISMKRGSINLGDGNFSVSNSGSVTMKQGSINLGSGNFSVSNYGDVTIRRGSIDIGNGNFTVDSSGNVVARTITLTEGTTGVIDANNLKIKNLIVGENVIMSPNSVISWQSIDKPNDIVYENDLNWNNLKDVPDDLAYANDIPKLPPYLKSTHISETSIYSPGIVGGEIVGAKLQTYSLTDDSGITILNNRISFRSETFNTCAEMYYDNNGNGETEGERRLFINTLGDYNLKIRSSKNISIDAGKLYLPDSVVFKNDYLDLYILNVANEVAYDIASNLIQSVLDKYFGV